MFKTGDLVEPDPSFHYFNDGRIIDIEKEIGPPPWKVVEESGLLVRIQGIFYRLAVERFQLFNPAKNQEPKKVDNWKNGLDLL